MREISILRGSFSWYQEKENDSESLEIYQCRRYGFKNLYNELILIYCALPDNLL